MHKEIFTCDNQQQKRRALGWEKKQRIFFLHEKR